MEPLWRGRTGDRAAPAVTGGALSEARAAAAELLGERGYDAEAAIVARGEGDDFAEVRTALALLRIVEKRAAQPMAARRFVRRMVGEEC